MSQYRYYCSGSDMSADLKRVTRRVRAARPELFAPIKVKDVHTAKDGTVTVSEHDDVRAVAMPADRRHRLSLQTERH